MMTKQTVVGSPVFYVTSGLTTFGFLFLGTISLLSLIPLFGASGSLLPVWFVRLFIPAALGFVGVCIAQAISSHKHVSVKAVSNQISCQIWLLIPLSFLMNASVHQFYAFRPEKILPLFGESLLSTLNALVIYFGIACSILFYWLFQRGQRELAVKAQIMTAFLILIPTCNCANPFNEFWNMSLGASPMMFVPTSFAILSSTLVSRGINVRINMLVVAITMLGTLLLGIGHITRIVW
jgi:hypothetical protein